MIKKINKIICTLIFLQNVYSVHSYASSWEDENVDIDIKTFFDFMPSENETNTSCQPSINCEIVPNDNLLLEEILASENITTPAPTLPDAVRCLPDDDLFLEEILASEDTAASNQLIPDFILPSHDGRNKFFNYMSHCCELSPVKVSPGASLFINSEKNILRPNVVMTSCSYSHLDKEQRKLLDEIVDQYPSYIGKGIAEEAQKKGIKLSREAARLYKKNKKKRPEKMNKKNTYSHLDNEQRKILGEIIDQYPSYKGKRIAEEAQKKGIKLTGEAARLFKRARNQKSQKKTMPSKVNTEDNDTSSLIGKRTRHLLQSSEENAPQLKRQKIA